ncbi:MAG TPA: hypothetical protein VFB06_24140 [Streptosporangiaceae bacterium]|nr:hypothetical protein [Streptosporangiaceae bacterium]
MPDARRTVQVNRMTATMLGVSKAGKTTYILGAYAALVNGVHGCHLHTADPDVGMDLLRQLNDLRAGKPTPPTPDEPVRYDFVLTRNGTAERTAMDLTDFRGGAAFDTANGKESDTARLHRRLLDTDAIFIVLDSEHFQEPLTGIRLHEVRAATGADRFADMVSKALADREVAGRPAPPIAVVLTKSDLIDGRPGSTPRDRGQVAAEVRRLMPALFRPGVHTMIFPVSVTGLVTMPDGDSPAMIVDLLDVADPVVFAVGWFLGACQAEVGIERDDAVRAQLEVEAALADLMRKNPIVRWFQRHAIDNTRTLAGTWLDTAAALNDRWHELGTQCLEVLSRFYPGMGEAAANDAMGARRLRPDRHLRHLVAGGADDPRRDRLARLRSTGGSQRRPRA